MIQPAPDVGQGQAINPHKFLARFRAMRKGNGSARQGETVREKSHQCGVGPALEGRRVKLHFERLAQPAGNLIPRGVGDDLEREGAARGCLGHRGSN